MQIRGRPLHVGVQLQAQDTSWADYLKALQSVEELGFGSAWTFDHILPFAGPDDRACFETLTTMGAWAAVTSRTRIGVLVNGVLYREPVVLAKAAAQVDQMTGGRLEFALGAAWAEREFATYGWPFPPVAERYARLEEALQVTKLLWGQHRTTFEGKYYRLHEAPCEPKPVQSPHPPITIGGTSVGTLRIAARHADRLNMIGSPEKIGGKIAKFEQLCAESGRDPQQVEFSVHPTLAIAATAGQAESTAAAIAAAQGADLATVRGSWVIGAPDDVAAQLSKYIALGVSHFVIAIGQPFDVGQLRLFVEEVLPALQG